MAKIICVVDNAAVDGSVLKTEHGVAFWIETENGKVLFDTGASAETLSVNLKVLGLKVADIDAMAFSHSHFDHTGGIEAVLTYRENLPVYANADIFRQKYSRHDGNFDTSGFEKPREEYEHRAEWHLSDAPTKILPDLWTTGLIKKRDYPEGRSAGHYIRKKGKFVPDPYLDDMSLVLKTEDGLVVICGCCHAGILNTLPHVKSTFKGQVTGIIGGIHLMVADKPMLESVLGILVKEYNNARYCLNHCTGDDAIRAFADTFGDQVMNFKAGSTIYF